MIAAVFAAIPQIFQAIAPSTVMAGVAPVLSAVANVFTLVSPVLASISTVFEPIPRNPPILWVRACGRWSRQ